jgi:acid stress-induced BolA-like protein IbaG/YrbA
MQQEVERLIREQIAIEHLDVEMVGNHCTVTVVSAEFEGLSPVKKQQRIYQCLNEKIASGEIHAVNIRALTPSQWQPTA